MCCIYCTVLYNGVCLYFKSGANSFRSVITRAGSFIRGSPCFSLLCVCIVSTTKAPFIWSRVPETTLPPSYPGRGNFWRISLQNQPTVYIRFANPSREARQLGWASCLTSPGRLTLASGATFLHINALARLTGTTREVSSVTSCLNLGFEAGIRIKEVKIDSAKPTASE